MNDFFNKYLNVQVQIIVLLFLIYTGLIIYFYVEVNKPLILLKNVSTEKGETKERETIGNKYTENERCNQTNQAKLNYINLIEDKPY